VDDWPTCPPAVLAAVPASLRDDFVSGNGHLETAVRLRANSGIWGVPLPGERDEVRVGWIALGHMMSRGLPLGPLTEVPARFVSRSKVHHRDCYLLRNPALQIAPLGDIAHRPYCSICDGPGFALTDDHLDYLWAVMAVDDITDPFTGLLRQKGRLGGSATAEEWQQERQDELAACEQIITAMSGLAEAEPRIATTTDDVILRTRYQRDRIQAALASGPDPGELASPSAPGRRCAWAGSPLPPPGPRVPATVATAAPESLVPGHPDDAALEEKRAARVISTRRTRNRVLSPAYVCGITHQRIEVAEAVTTAGRVRGDPALAHPVWGASYEWMAARLAEKHPPSAGRALFWGIITNSIAHGACDSSCGNGLPVCGLFHPYPGHASLLIQVPEKRVLVSDWPGWDKLVFGGYIPVDEADSAAFGQMLADRFGADIPQPQAWPPDLVEKARTSWIRCLRVNLDGFSRPDAGHQFVVSELRTTDVSDIVAGPPLSSADRWWDCHLTRHPDEVDRRDRSSTPIGDIRSVQRP
jgi:hypothetical protein